MIGFEGGGGGGTGPDNRVVNGIIQNLLNRKANRSKDLIYSEVDDFVYTYITQINI